MTDADDLNVEDLFVSNWFDNRGTNGTNGVQNEFNVDFKLYSNFDDALDDRNEWEYCNFNVPGIGCKSKKHLCVGSYIPI